MLKICKINRKKQKEQNKYAYTEKFIDMVNHIGVRHGHAVSSWMFHYTWQLWDIMALMKLEINYTVSK